MSNYEKHKARLAADWSKVFPGSPPPAAVPVEQPCQLASDATLPAIAPSSIQRPAKKKPRIVPVVAASSSMEKLKGLSLRQPWAEEVMRGEKVAEYRQRPAKHRGRVYIYASSSRFTKDEEDEFAVEVGYAIDDLPRGVIIGTVEITDCVESEEDDGVFVWQLENPQRIDPPVPPIERAQPIWFHPFGRPDS